MKLYCCGVILFSLSAVMCTASPVLTTTTGALRSDGHTTSVDFWTFHNNSLGILTFDILSAEAFPTYFDAQLFLFRNNGPLEDRDLIVSVDDSDYPGIDGSTLPYDPYLQLLVPRGEFVLAIAQCCAESTQVVRSGATPFTFFVGPGTTAQYQITWIGDVSDIHLQGTATPEPATCATLALGFAALLFVRQKLSRKQSQHNELL